MGEAPLLSFLARLASEGARYREIQGDLGRYREIQGGLGRYGRARLAAEGKLGDGLTLTLTPNPNPNPNPNP